MESEFFLNGQTPSSSIPSWPPLHHTMEMQGGDCFLSGWEKSTDHGLQFDSALSSLVSSPAASNSNVPNESFMIRELIGKLGNIGGEISPHSQPMLAASYSTNTGNNSNNTSCYSTPLNSPPKVNHDLHEDFNFPGLGKSLAAEFAADPGFIQRAARFSSFGSRSFNGRTNQVSPNNAELAAAYNVKLSRVSSSPSLKVARTQKGNKSLEPTELRNSSSQEESTLSEQATNGGEAGLKELNCRKRKVSSKGKAKDTPPTNPVKEGETKRSKSNEGSVSENNLVKAEEDSKGGSEEEDDSKPSEPLKDYIHVRARRGQATDSHSLAERVRREKIGERMKLLQDLVPGCNKVTGKALMLDEIINYVQSLQRQVEFLSMKVSCVNTARLDINMETLTSKDIFQSNHHPMFPLDSSASAIFGHQPLQNPGLHTNLSNGNVTHCSVDPLDSALCHNPNFLDGFHPTAAQYSAFCDGDLQSIVQMSFGQNSGRERMQSQIFQGSNQASHMKLEL